MLNNQIPTYDSMMNPALQALHELGGSATIEELFNKVAEIMGLTDEQLEIIHDPNRGSQTEIDYRLAWTRSYLKKYGIVENSGRGIWALTPKGLQTQKVNPKDVIKHWKEQKSLLAKEGNQAEGKEEVEMSWKEHLLQTLLKMKSDAFERLVQRMLRESGFIQVEVTGRSGDGGIDGKGIMRLGGLLSFHVIFQCKRYQGSVTPSQVRDFRGAMVGRADKGLLITTGTFTKDAMREATRDGAPAIDLIDGELLMDKLLECNCSGMKA
ncbi:MAG: restriction endonuclease [Anaerolineales bacterium]|nr:restriction endonuclease [Anaerolineales bacterium]